MKIFKSTWPVVILAALLIAIPITGCANHQPTQVTLPAGAINSADAQFNAVLQAGHAAAAQYLTDKASGFVPSATLASTMSVLIKSLNIADPLYQAYHTTLSTNPTAPAPAALTSAVNDIKNSLNSIATIKK